jgi:surface protein
MFYECRQIKEIDFSGLNITGSVTDIGWLFDHCTKIKTINFGDNFNIKKCQSFRSTFDTCESLTELDMSKIKGNPTISNIENMLYQCENIDILKFPKMDILKDSQMRTAFYNMNTPKIFNVSGVKNGTTSEEAYAEFKRNLTLRMYNPNIVE